MSVSINQWCTNDTNMPQLHGLFGRLNGENHDFLHEIFGCHMFTETKRGVSPDIMRFNQQN